MEAPQHQEVLRCLFRESNDAFFLFDPKDLLVIDLNPAALRLTGLDKKAALKMRVTGLFSSDTPDGVERLIDAYRKTGVFHSREDYYLTRAKGEPIAVNLSASRIHTTPEPIGLVVVRDISERRKAQEMLERYFRLSPALFGILGDDGRFLNANSAWRESMGYSVDELKSVEVVSLVPPEDRAAAEPILEPSPSGASPREVRFRHKDGSDRWLSWSSTRVDGNNYAVALDVTSLKQADDLRRAKESAEAASRAKGQFLSNMSHELRTPLTAILALVDVLIGDPMFQGISKERAEDFLTIRRNGDFLLQLINSILDLAKIEGGSFTAAIAPCDPKTIVAEVVELMRVRADAKALPLDVVYSTPIPSTILTDPIRLRQIVLNLVGNAIKFTEKGRVRIEMSVRSSMLQVAVIDSGIGLKPEELTALFQPFQQIDPSLRRSASGTGLGLAISQRLAEALAGSIAVESQSGVGSTFRLSIPLIEPRRAATESRTFAPAGSLVVAPRPTSNGSPARPRRVLLAEDNADNRRAIKLRLEQVGLDVSTAQNGQEAYDTALSASAEGRTFDVILMDMQMPVLDGYEATRQLRVRGYDGPIVALTAFALEEDREECLRFGCNDHLSKPIDWVRLIGLIEQLA